MAPLVVPLLASFVGLAPPSSARAPDLEVRAASRIARDAAAGRPIVAHVFVVLADNDAQGIVPVPRALGDGRAPKTNLYWGARYGVGHWLASEAGWTRGRARPLDHDRPSQPSPRRSRESLLQAPTLHRSRRPPPLHVREVISAPRHPVA